MDTAMGSAASKTPVVETSRGDSNQLSETENIVSETKIRKHSHPNCDYGNEDKPREKDLITVELSTEDDENTTTVKECLEPGESDLTTEGLSEEDDEETTKFKEYHAQRVIVIQKAIELNKSFPNFVEENGKIREPVMTLIYSVYESVFIPKNLNCEPQTRTKHIGDITTILEEKKIIHTICDVLNYIHSKWVYASDTLMDNKSYYNFRICFGTVHNYTDVCESFSVAVCKVPGFVNMMKAILLEYWKTYLDKSRKTQIHVIVRSVLGVMHNITMIDSCVTCVRHIGFTEVVKNYLKSEKKDDKLLSLSILAAIIDEEDIEVIRTNKNTVHLLVDVLEDGLNNKLRQGNVGDNHHWSCAEAALVIRQLAGNNENKKILVEAGCLKWLVKLGKTAVNATETLESLGAIWALAFDREICKGMLSDEELGVLDLLLELQESDNPKIKQMCDGALWTIRQEHKNSNTNEVNGDVDKTNTVDGHVMISYQWDDQKMVIQIRDRLEHAGFKVWIDIEEMNGSIPAAMASAVENANVFLMCMSQKYQNSLNCQSEADYAYQLQKTVMPLKLERNYKPRSWTGIICGGKKFYEFTGKYNFDSKLKELIRDLAKTKQDTGPLKSLSHHPLKAEPDNATDSVPVTMAAPMSYSSHVSDVTIDTIRGWTQEDIDKWIERNNLQSCGINKRTGKEIALLITMRTECPEFFYRCLDKKWDIKDTLALADIVWALKDLTKELEQKKPG